MANEDELRLRIIADTTEFERQMAELGRMSETVSRKPPGTDRAKGADPLKAKLDGLRAEIDLTDLSLRKTLTASQRKEQAIRQEAALAKRTQEESARLIAQEENARTEATNNAIANFNRIEAELAQLDQSQQAVINRQKQLFFASERARNGFTTMSGAMTDLTSNTKMANITFANFGRIVQDAPFGLLGISNNIDPLLNSFRMLRAESTSTGDAFRKLIMELRGPAGLIFLLGSALPTALLLLQKYKRDTGKEANTLSDAIKKVRDEFARLSSEAAGEQGLETINDELGKNKKALDSINDSLATYRENSLKILQLQNQGLQQGGRTEEQRRELNRLIRENANLNIQQLEADKAIIESSTAELEVAKARIQEENNLTEARRRYGIASALVDKENREASIERLKQLQSEREAINAITEAIRQARAAEEDRLQAAQKARFEQQQKVIEGILEGSSDSIDQAVQKDLSAIRLLGQLEIDEARATGRERDAIELERQRKRLETIMMFNQAGIKDQETINRALAVVDKEAADKQISLARLVSSERIEQFHIIAEAASATLGAIFGENKVAQSAAVVIDTLAGAQKAFAKGLPFGAIEAAGILAKGVVTLRRIQAVDQKKGASLSGASAAPATRTATPPFVSDRPFLATPLASSVASTMMPGNVIPINVEARIDQAGLALAVRRGEGVIASRQIPFAS